MKWLFPKCANPLVPDTLRNRYAEWICGKDFKNCITIGTSFIAPQAWCARCGHRNKGLAADHVPEWQLPDRIKYK